MDQKPIPTISEQSQLLVMHLLKCEQASYEELAAIVGEPVNAGRGAGWLTTARRVIEREHNQVWVSIRKYGIKRATTAEVIDSAQSEVKKVHKASRRGIKRIATLDFSKIENAEKLRLHTVSSHLALLHYVTSSRQREHLSSAVSVQNDKLPLAKTLDAFRANSEG